MSEQVVIKLSDVIAPAFYPVHYDIIDGLHENYDLYGGRGSTKSSFISVEIILGMMQDPNANAAVFRRRENTIGGSVFEQLEWAIDVLGVSEYWKRTVSPYKLTYKPTGQSIVFKGLDEPKKIKSIKTAKGYFKYLWFEELDEFNGDKDIRSVEQSILRGGPKYVVFKSFNPPISNSNWANTYVQTPKAGALRHKSCYLDVPEEWLGQKFLDDAEDLKMVNPRAYEHEYLGVPVGTGGEVFTNLEIRTITDEELSHFDQIYMGIDWGWYPDPFQWVKVHYDANRRKLYFMDEFRANKMSNRDTWDHLVKEHHVNSQDLITADSAEPKSVGDYRSYGSLCRGAVKGPDSVRYGMKWLQSLAAIVIDPARTPNVAKEFREYEYERNKDDEVVSGYPDANNHSIDATRYALERYYKRKGQ